MISDRGGELCILVVLGVVKKSGEEMQSIENGKTPHIYGMYDGENNTIIFTK